MDEKKYSFKDVFSLRIRLCLLAALLIFILGFLFSPEMRVEPVAIPPPDTGITIIPIPDDHMVRIKERPVNEISDVIDNNIAEDEKPPVQKPAVKPEIPFVNNKQANIPFGKYVFVPYDEEPKPLNLDEINFKYPESMKMLGIGGKVNLQLLIDKKGNVIDVVQMDSLHPTLDKVAVENARKVKFSPAMQRDKPVKIWYGFWVDFKIK
jgi:protein TonB